eukprot:CCRYP_012099-RE/>CCRYP_012099-RE protein AED:0.25 eAED:0.25 QI:252/1/0.5/1/1/0.5/2/0/677
MKFALLVAGSSMTVNGLMPRDSNHHGPRKTRKLRGNQRERNLPYNSQPLTPPTSSWGSDGFEPVITPSPTPWTGDSWGGLSTGGWGTDGWEGGWSGSWEGNLKVTTVGGAKSNKMGVYASGGSSKTNSINYVQVSGSSSGGSKSNKSGFLNLGGSSSKSDKDIGFIGGSKGTDTSVYVSSKSDKGTSANLSSGTFKAEGGNGVYISVSGTKVAGGSAKVKAASHVNPVNSIKPITSNWSDDGYAQAYKRGKWTDDGWVSGVVTPRPTPHPTWQGDAHPLVTPPPIWKGDAHLPTNKPVVPLVTPTPTWKGDAHLPTSKPVIPFVTPPLTWKGDAHPPTNKPVVPLVTLAPSPLPTSCEERMVWHPNPDYTACTNNDNYSPDSPYIYISLESCCKALFGTPTCDYEDICITPAPSTSPVVAIVTPAPSSAPTSCEERMWWHPNPGFTICTNDSVYPSNWATPEMFDQYFHESLSQCCMAVFGTSTCTYVDICSTPAPSASPVVEIVTPAPSSAPTSCEERMWWHPNPGFTICTNDSVYPSNWATPEMFDQYFHESLSQCCMAVFGTSTCTYVDICTTPGPSASPVVEIVTPAPSFAPTSCDERMWWHPNPGFTICTNDSVYPSNWATPEMFDQYFHESFAQCCIAVFGTMANCEYVDICITPTPTMSPVTGTPTLPPT